jgi:deoxycytidylate deaminase
VGENQHREMTGRKYHISLHAEIHALFQALKNNRKYDLEKSYVHQLNLSTIYVTRLLNNNDTKYRLGNAKPCENCQKYLKLYKVKRIKYTDVIDGKNMLCEMRLM